MTDLSARKAAARAAAVLRRDAAQRQVDQTTAQRHLQAFLSPYADRILGGYMPIRSEIDPLPVMADWAATAPVCVPLILGDAKPLKFARWQPGVDMIAGSFNVPTPAQATLIVPQVIVVPLLAFGPGGARLGYGKGHYDRTLAALRRTGSVIAVGFAYDAQFDPGLPQEPTDQPLDALVTESGVVFRGKPLKDAAKPLAPGRSGP